MPRIYKKFDGIECRACGSAFAQPDSRGSFCQPCMNRLVYQYGENIDDLIINKWLARQLELNVARIKTYGFSYKCECFTKQDQNQNAGYQCPRYATTIYNGRHVCKVHERSLVLEKEKRKEDDFPSRNSGISNHHRECAFIEELKDPYENLESLIRDLCDFDEDFKNAVKRAVL